ncbi:hypothetical protein HOL24_00515 [bacterium]|nr:hypothetical protein [bacterium]
MKYKLNLFIVSNALQLINSIEASNYFKCENNILLIIHNPYDLDDKNSAQMDRLIKYNDWEAVLKYNAGKHKERSYFSYIGLLRELKKNDYDYIFFGRPEKMFHCISLYLQKNKIIYLDEGTSTINYYYNFFALNKKTKLDLKQKILLWPLRLGIQSDNISTGLFTYFDLKPLSNLSIERNNLSWFRKIYFSNFKSDNSVYFLGDYGFGEEDEDEYDNNLSHFIQMQTRRVIYVPHRYGKTRKYLDEILKKNDVKVLKIGIPIEIYFLVNKMEPYMVAGSLSSAFFTLSLLCSKTKFQALYINLDKKNPKMEQKKYKELARVGVEVINMKNNNKYIVSRVSNNA